MNNNTQTHKRKSWFQPYHENTYTSVLEIIKNYEGVLKIIFFKVENSSVEGKKPETKKRRIVEQIKFDQDTTKENLKPTDNNSVDKSGKGYIYKR